MPLPYQAQKRDNAGGICNFYATLVITNSTISGNTATDKKGGGIGSWGDGCNITINNSTISGNISNLYGGGIYIETGAAISNSTIANNTAPRW